MEPSLSQGVGYGVVIGLGVFFALMMNLVTLVQNKFTKHNSHKADEFTSASRDIPFGLIVCGIVSSWTWSLTLLQSATESYNIGFSGSYWYAIGGLLQVSVFSIVASRVKKNANLVTTFPEMGFFRFGNKGHLAFLWCGLVCNAIVSACILLGGSAVVTAITGMNDYLALFLIPLGVALFVSFGGLRATFISDATHTFVLIIFVMVFFFKVYTSGDKIGSPQKMWELLQLLDPVADNYHGSYLTFRSRQGAIFAVQSIITGFGLVACDQAYWSRAIAAEPKKTSSAYFFAAGAWFVIPFAMGASLGLAARALSNYPDFPILSDEDVSAGLVSVASATYLMGKTGSAMMFVMVFLSVTSSFSGELIATSTLLSYDVYKKYFRPHLSPTEVLTAAKVSVFLWAVFAGGLASIFKGALKISMGWLFNFLGVATASGVFPILLTFTWSGLTTAGAVGGSIGGMLLALIVWLVMCKAYLGEINVTNLSSEWVSFAGNCAALFLGGIISIGVSLIKPANFDWDITRNKTILTDESDAFAPEESSSSNASTSEPTDEVEEHDEKKQELDVNSISIISVSDIDHLDLDRQFKKYTILVIIVAVIATFIVPIPLGAAPYVFSPKFLAAFISIIIVWLFYTLFLVIVLPVYESRKDIWRITKSLFNK